MTARYLLALVFGLAACQADPMLGVRQAYAVGDYVAAHEQLLQLRNSDSDNAHLYSLELGITSHALGQPKEAIPALRSARDRLDELAGTGFFESFGAMFLDDRSLDYEGADYEQVLVRAILAVADLMSGGLDAGAYAFQVLDRQQQIIKSFDDGSGHQPKNSYKLVAFGSYLRAIINEESARHIRTAENEFAKVQELEPDFPFAAADLERVREGQHSAKGNGVVHVIAMVGRAPFRQELRIAPTGPALAIAQLIWNHHRDRTVIPNITKVPIPVLAMHADNPRQMFVQVNGEFAGQTAVITDVEAMALAEFAAMRDHIIARAVLRRLLKLTVVEASKEILENQKSKKHSSGNRDKELGQLGIDLIGIIWTAMEKADLRCWSLLPATFQVLRLELPAGDHEIGLRVGRGGRPTGAEQFVRVHVRDGYNTYVLALAPTLHGGPPPLTSEPSEPVEPLEPEEEIP